jgi:hypothetical protein
VVFNIPDDLTTMPDDPVEVCALIRHFLVDWQVMEVDGVEPDAEEEVAAAESRLGFTLPVALRWMLTHVGTDNRVIGLQDPFVPPSALAVDDEGVLTYRRENQNCAIWGVPVSEIGRPDPPVLWNNMTTRATSIWAPYQQRLSVDLLEMALGEAMLLPGANTIHMDVGSQPPVQLAELTPLAIPRHVFWASVEGGTIAWYGLRDCLIRDDGGTWLWAYGRNAEVLDAVRDRIPGDWEELVE